MFSPNVACFVSTETSNNVYGESQFGPRRRELCAVVILETKSVHTSVRADATATRGHAEEYESVNKILLGRNTVAIINSKLEVSGVILRIVSKQPRIALDGSIDHYEVTCALWA